MSLSDLYDERYREEDYRRELESYELARWAALRHFVPRVAPDRVGTVVDYGSGRGAFVPLWREIFPEARLIGADISRAALELLARDHPGVETSLIEGHTARLDDGLADLVVSVEVMEHVGDLAAYLRDVRRVLRPGGAFVWTTPCANALSVEHLYATVTRQVDPTPNGSRRWRWEDPTHLRRLTTAEARAALARHGFDGTAFRMRGHLFSFLCDRVLTRFIGRQRVGRLVPLMKLDYALFRRLPNGASMLGVSYAAREPR